MSNRPVQLAPEERKLLESRGSKPFKSRLQPSTEPRGFDPRSDTGEASDIIPSFKELVDFRKEAEAEEKARVEITRELEAFQMMESGYREEREKRRNEREKRRNQREKHREVEARMIEEISALQPTLASRTAEFEAELAKKDELLREVLGALRDYRLILTGLELPPGSWPSGGLV